MELAKAFGIHATLALFMFGSISLAVWSEVTYPMHHVVPFGTAMALVLLDKWARRRFWPHAR